MTQLIKEACVETLQQAIQAEKQGAQRIELCSELDKDGLTPSLSLIQSVQNSVRIPVKVMVRPREGNFVYSDAEILQMKKSIDLCKEQKVAGVVFGILNNDRTINTFQTKELADYAQPLEVTFHKAIDITPDLTESVKVLATINSVDAILTSGGQNTAAEGEAMINAMIETANAGLTIVAAGKVSHENLNDLKTKINTNEFHGKRIVGALD